MRNFALFFICILFFACSDNEQMPNQTTVAVESETAKASIQTSETIKTKESTVVKDTAEMTSVDADTLSSDEKSLLAEVKEVVAEKEVAVEKKVEKVVNTVEKASKAKSVKPKPVKKKRPKINFNEKTWAFGDIKAGEVVNHDFKFKNTGDAPLLIKNVTASCGCTQPSFPFLPIEPGEEGVIGVSFNSTGKINEQRPTVTVVTNSSPSTYKLHLEGMVRVQ